MPRKGPAPKRPLVVDPVYQSPLVTALVNKILLDGKKSIAETIVYGALEGCREKTGTDPVETLKRALDNIKPTLEVKSRRVGGATYQVPVEVKPNRATIGLPREDRHRPGPDAQARARQHQADPGGQVPPRRRCDLPGPDRGQADPRHDAVAALARRLLASAS